MDASGGAWWGKVGQIRYMQGIGAIIWCFWRRIRTDPFSLVPHTGTLCFWYVFKVLKGSLRLCETTAMAGLTEDKSTSDEDVLLP